VGNSRVSIIHCLRRHVMPSTQVELGGQNGIWILFESIDGRSCICTVTSTSEIERSKMGHGQVHQRNVNKLRYAPSHFAPPTRSV